MRTKEEIRTELERLRQEFGLPGGFPTIEDDQTLHLAKRALCNRIRELEWVLGEGDEL